MAGSRRVGQRLSSKSPGRITNLVIPAKAGIQGKQARALQPWAPAFAGATVNFLRYARHSRPESFLEIEAQAGLGPIHRGQLADAGKGDVGGLHIPASKANVGRVDVGHFDLANDVAVGRDDGDVPGDQCRDGDIARALDRETVEALEA